MKLTNHGSWGSWKMACVVFMSRILDTELIGGARSRAEVLNIGHPMKSSGEL